MAFLDVDMGRISDFEVCEKLLKTSPVTNVIYVTALSDNEHKAHKTEAKGFILKPLIAQRLTEELKSLNFVF